jgi:muramoyltetrapeptide carboxypeptidase
VGPVLPPALRPGSRVALVAPSGPLLEPDHLVRGEELCQAMGWVPVLMPNAGERHGYLAGTDAQRLEDLNRALTDTDIDAVWCLRGGNGMNRIIEGVDFEGFAASPRPVIGYSDITVLLNALTTVTGIVTFHGPMARFALAEFSRRQLELVTATPAPAGTLARVDGDADTLVPARGRVVTVIPGMARGRLAGGNLTLMQALIGTRYFPNLNGAILFLEDIGEDVHRIDRMLAHLRMVRAFEGLAGVAVGHFSRMRHATVEGTFGLDQLLRHYFASLDIPVAHGFPIGHVTRQWTLPLGVMAELDATAGTVALLEPAVR